MITIGDRSTLILDDYVLSIPCTRFKIKNTGSSLERILKENQKLKDELDVYKPLLLSLVSILVCLGLWLVILSVTGDSSVTSHDLIH